MRYRKTTIVAISGVAALTIAFLLLRNTGWRREHRALEPILSTPFEAGDTVRDANATRRSLNVISRGASDEINDAGFEAALERELSSWVDPVQLQRRKASIVLNIEIEYGRLFQSLSRGDPAVLSALKDLLATHAFEFQRLMAGSAALDDESLQWRLSEAEEMRRRRNDALKELLGAEHHEIVEIYEESMGYRPTIESIANIMRSRGVAVSDEMQDALLTAYTITMRKATQSAVRTQSALENSRGVTQAEVRMRLMNALDETLVREYANVLDEHTLAAFLDAQLAYDTKTGSSRAAR